MRNIKLRIPLFLGTRRHAEGTVLPVDDNLARRLVALGQAEAVALVDPVVTPQKAVAPRPPEKATAPKPPADADAPKPPENAKAKA